MEGGGLTFGGAHTIGVSSLQKLRLLSGGGGALTIGRGEAYYRKFTVCLINFLLFNRATANFVFDKKA